jgi:hypothetical protein
MVTYIFLNSVSWLGIWYLSVQGIRLCEHEFLFGELITTKYILINARPYLQKLAHDKKRMRRSW